MSVSVRPHPAEHIRIPVPRQFRDYLIAVQNRRFVFSLSLYTAVLLFFRFVARWGWHVDIVQIAFIIASVVSWCLHLKKPWYYAIDEEQMTVIWFELKGRTWRWLPIKWIKSEIMAVEETEWRGLPALRVVQRIKYPKWRPDLLIVYAHQDAERVRTQVLPLIEQYRRQYRTPLWADRLREG